ncbi:MAG TPA: hypothetical protein VGI75_12770 [Pirellulales bacterium]
MSIVVQCLSCAQQFDAPEELRGRRVQCPACGAAINVPVATKAPPAVMTPNTGGMMDLLKEESKTRRGGAEKAKGFDKDTIAALGISERKLFSGKAKAPPAEPTARPIVYGGPFTHKLVILVAAASLGFLALTAHLEKTSIGVIIWSFGILLAMATWRSQAMAKSNRKIADDWRSFERWVGWVVIALMFGYGTWRIGVLAYVQLNDVLPLEGWKGIGKAMGLLALAWLGVLLYCVLMLNRSAKIGFFRCAAWTYVLCFLIGWWMVSSGRWPTSRVIDGGGKSAMMGLHNGSRRTDAALLRPNDSVSNRLS